MANSTSKNKKASLSVKQFYIRALEKLAVAEKANVLNLIAVRLGKVPKPTELLLQYAKKNKKEFKEELYRVLETAVKDNNSVAEVSLVCGWCNDPIPTGKKYIAETDNRHKEFKTLETEVMKVFREKKDKAYAGIVSSKTEEDCIQHFNTMQEEIEALKTSISEA